MSGAIHTVIAVMGNARAVVSVSSDSHTIVAVCAMRHTWCQGPPLLLGALVAVIGNAAAYNNSEHKVVVACVGCTKA